MKKTLFKEERERERERESRFFLLLLLLLLLLLVTGKLLLSPESYCLVTGKLLLLYLDYFLYSTSVLFLFFILWLLDYCFLAVTPRALILAHLWISVDLEFMILCVLKFRRLMQNLAHTHTWGYR